MPSSSIPSSPTKSTVGMTVQAAIMPAAGAPIELRALPRPALEPGAILL